LILDFPAFCLQKPLEILKQDDEMNAYQTPKTFLHRRLGRLAWLLRLAAAIMLLGVSMGSPAPAQQAALARAPWAADVDKVFVAYDSPDSPGCAVGIYRDGKIVYERGFGSADLEHNVPIEADTMFYAGSVSKQFTAMAVALAIKQGLFGLDDDIRQWIPELPDYGTPITVRHLIHHTSGLRDINTLMEIAGRRDEEAFDNDAVLRIIARQKALNFKPGDEYLYSNSGYAMLALLVQRAAHKSYAEFANANIFKPLGMTATHFHTDLGRLIKHRAFGYDGTKPGAIRLNTPQNERAGAGGLFTSVHELQAWDENFYTGLVGGRNVITQLETPGKLNDGTALNYAWGLEVGAYRGLPIVEHSGALGGYRAQIIRFREQHFTVALLCNSSEIEPARLSRRVADVCLKEVFPQPAPAPNRNPARNPDETAGPRTKYTSEDAAGFAGAYYSDELETTYRVKVEGAESLWLTRGAQPKRLPLEAGARDQFRAGGSTLRFERDAIGQVTGFTVDAGRIRGVKFLRVAARQQPPNKGFEKK
jgi:CubicO group peptidase (beta-lactamase class C family)